MKEAIRRIVWLTKVLAAVAVATGCAGGSETSVSEDDQPVTSVTSEPADSSADSESPAEPSESPAEPSESPAACPLVQESAIDAVAGFDAELSYYNDGGLLDECYFRGVEGNSADYFAVGVAVLPSGMTCWDAVAEKDVGSGGYSAEVAGSQYAGWLGEVGAFACIDDRMLQVTGEDSSLDFVEQLAILNAVAEDGGFRDATIRAR